MAPGLLCLYTEMRTCWKCEKAQWQSSTLVLVLWPTASENLFGQEKCSGNFYTVL